MCLTEPTLKHFAIVARHEGDYEGRRLVKHRVKIPEREPQKAIEFLESKGWNLGPGYTNVCYVTLVSRWSANRVDEKGCSHKLAGKYFNEKTYHTNVDELPSRSRDGVMSISDARADTQ